MRRSTLCRLLVLAMSLAVTRAGPPADLRALADKLIDDQIADPALPAAYQPWENVVETCLEVLEPDACEGKPAGSGVLRNEVAWEDLPNGERVMALVRRTRSRRAMARYQLPNDPGWLGCWCHYVAEVYRDRSQADRRFAELKARAPQMRLPASKIMWQSGEVPADLPADRAFLSIWQAVEPFDDIPRPKSWHFRSWLVQVGHIVGMFEIRVFGLYRAPEAAGGPYPTGATALIEANSERLLRTWLTRFPYAATRIEWETPHAALTPTYDDPWTFAQAEPLAVGGVVIHQGQPLANATFVLRLKSPADQGYTLAEPTTDSNGRFAVDSFLAPHAAVGTWQLLAKGTIGDDVWLADRNLEVVEDPRLTANQLRKNLQMIADAWKQGTRAGPTVTTWCGADGALLRGAQWIASAYPAGALGPLNNNMATLHGLPYLDYTCGKCTERTLNMLNSWRYSDSYEKRKLFLGIAYCPVEHWPNGYLAGDSLARVVAYNYWHNHIAVLLFTQGYEHLGWQTDLRRRQYSAWVGILKYTQEGIHPDRGMVLEPWVNQRPECWSIAQWVHAFGQNTAMRLPADTDTWAYFAPIPGHGGDYAQRRGYVGEGKQPGAKFQETIQVLTLSPVDVLAVRADGRRVGFAPDLGQVLEIDEAACERWELDGATHQYLVLPAGDYTFTVTGTGAGEFGLTIASKATGVLNYPQTPIAKGATATLAVAANRPGNVVLADGREIAPSKLATGEPVHPNRYPHFVVAGSKEFPGEPIRRREPPPPTAPPDFVMYWTAPRQAATFAPHPWPVADLAIRPDGKVFATACWNGSWGIWNVADGSAVHPCQEAEAPVEAIAFAKGGDLLAVGDRSGRLTVCRTADLRPVWTDTYGACLVSLASDATGNALCVATKEGRVLFIDPATGKTQRDFRLALGKRLVQCYFTPNGQRALVNGDGARIWTCDRRYVDIESNFATPDYATCGASSRAGKLFAFGDSGGRVHLFAVDPDGELPDSARAVAVLPQELNPLSGQPASVNGLAFTPDGKVLIASYFAGGVVVWDVATRRQLHLIPTGKKPFTALALTPDGRSLLLADYAGRVHLYTGSE